MDFEKEDIEKLGALDQKVINLKEQMENVVKNFNERFDELTKTFKEFMAEDKKKFDILSELMHRMKKIEEQHEKDAKEKENDALKTIKVNKPSIFETLYKMPAFLLSMGGLLGALIEFLIRLPPN